MLDFDFDLENVVIMAIGAVVAVAGYLGLSLFTASLHTPILY